MRTQSQNLSCASAFVLQNSINTLCTFYRMHIFLNWRNILSWIPFGSDLDPNHVCKCRRRETQRETGAGTSKLEAIYIYVYCFEVKVNIASMDRQVERERELCMYFFFNFVSFFYSGNSSTYFKVLCQSLQKKIWLYEMSSGFNSWVQSRTQNYWVWGTILTGIWSRQSERKRFGFLKGEQNSVVIHR